MLNKFFQHLTMDKIKTLLWLGIFVYLVYSIYQIYFYIPDINFTTIQLKTLDNQDIQLREEQLNSAIIFFFQTWCGPCLSEMNLFQRHCTDFKFTNVYFITDEPIEKVLKLKQRWQLDSLNIFISPNSLSSLGIQAFPTCYIIKKNKVVETHKGSFIDESNYEDELYHLQNILK